MRPNPQVGAALWAIDPLARWAHSLSRPKLEGVCLELVELEEVSRVLDCGAFVEELAGEQDRRDEARAGPDIEGDARVDQGQEGIEHLVFVSSRNGGGKDGRSTVGAQAEVGNNSLQVVFDAPLINLG